MKGFLSRMMNWKSLKRCMAFMLALMMVFSMIPGSDLVAVAAEGGVGNLEFQGGSRVGDSNEVSFTIGGKAYIVALTTVEGTSWSTHGDNAEWTNIPDNTSVTFTLTLPEGETNLPSLDISGARENFTLNDGVYSCTRTFSFSSQNIYFIQLQTEEQHDNVKGTFEFADGIKAGDGNAVSFSMGEQTYVVTMTTVDGTIWETNNGNAVWRNIPNGTEITFTLTLPDGETNVPSLVISGARETFTQSDGGYSFTRTFGFSEQSNFCSIQLQMEGQNNPGPGGQPKGVLNFVCQDNKFIGGHISYKINGASEFSSVGENREEQVYECIDLNAIEPLSSFTIKLNLEPGYQLDAGRGVNLFVNREARFSGRGDNVAGFIGDNGYTFDLSSILTGEETVENSIFELEFGFINENGEVPGNPNMLWVYSEEYGQAHQFLDPQGNVDCLVTNGDVDIIAIEYDGVTYSKNELLELGRRPDGERGEVWYQVDSGNMGYAEIPTGAIVTVKLLPDYGYQVLRAELNGSEIAPTEEQSVFKFTMPTNNLHLSAVFTACEDEVVTSTSAIESGSVLLGANEMDAGSALLTVGDADNASAFDGTMRGLAGYEIASCLDIGLQQVFYKGTKDDYWANSKDSLDSKATISLSLNDAVGTDVKVLHEKHDGTVEILDATVRNGVVTFETDSFSTYAIVRETNSLVLVEDDTVSEANTDNARIESSTLENILTDEDRAAIEAGIKVKVKLEERRLTEEAVPKAEKNAIADILPTDYKVGAYLDIKLWKQVGDSAPGKVTELNKGIAITIKIPESLRKQNYDYKIITVHEGMARDIVPVVNKSNWNLTFKTDKLSTYAICYNETTSGTEENNNNSASEQSDNVSSTSESSNVVSEPATRIVDVTYVVVRGDTMFKIAKKYGLSLAQLKSLNPQIKNINRIYVGQKIIVGKTTIQANDNNKKDILIKEYIVKKGDNLFKIAKSHKITLKKLIQMNPQIKKVNLIYPGQVIYINE